MYVPGFRNENGLRLVNLWTEQILRIKTTFFQQRDKYETTWYHPRTKQWHRIDHITTSTREAENVLRCRLIGAVQCKTDHNIVRARIKQTL